MTVPLPQRRVARLIARGTRNRVDFLLRRGKQRSTGKRLGARQLALSCHPIVVFDCVPDLVLQFTILPSG
jgi:hypothetical protein